MPPSAFLFVQFLFTLTHCSDEGLKGAREGLPQTVDTIGPDGNIVACTD